MNGALAVFAVLGAVLGIPALIALSAMWRGYVLSIIWGWFLVPYLHAPPITVPVAIGISLIVGALTNHRTGRELEKEESAGAAFVRSLLAITLTPATVLLMAWIVTKFL